MQNEGVGMNSVNRVSQRHLPRQLWGILMLVAAGPLFGAEQPQVTTQAAATRPNVVIVLIDDLDSRSLDRMVSIGKMPKLKAGVLSVSTQFSNSFVTTSWCCPSRATLFTGLYSHNHHVLTNSRPLGGVTRFDDSSSLAIWLQDSGYRTGLVGKYFNNYGADNDPNTPVDDVGYVPPGWDDWQGLMDQDTDGLRAFQMYNYTINDNGTLVKHGTAAADYQTDVIARSARQFIDEAETINDAQPFFLVVAPTAPHLETPTPILTGCSDSVWNASIRPAPRHIGTLPAEYSTAPAGEFQRSGLERQAKLVPTSAGPHHARHQLPQAPVSRSAHFAARRGRHGWRPDRHAATQW